jgi:hypothetical protein
MHEKVYCTECHFRPVFTDVGKNCADCHADIHRRQFGANCAQCHTVSGWNVSVQAVQNHFNRFPLLGAHAVVQCDECHKSAAVGQFQGLSTACSSCHMKDWQSTTSPAHASAPTEFPPNQCQQCHGSFDTWLGATVRHDLPPISFPLTLGHANVACEQCHVGGNFTLKIAANQCGTSGCHLITWQQTNAPVHSAAGPSFAVANCSNCHTPAGWTAPFNHSTTGFTLIGTHMSPTPTPCASCHVNNNYSLSSTDCYGCHQAAFMSTTSMGGNVPNHVTAGFPTTASACATCHSITTWAAGVFDHSATGFALTNGHANVACGLCHINNNYTLRTAATDCGNSGCHLTTWSQTNNPVHSTAGTQFAASNCAVCHNTVSWTTATFDHSATGFALTGMHISPSPTPCISCHVSNNYTLTSTACYGCHVAYWQSTATLGAAVPNHMTSGYPTTCESCHTTTSWLGAVFNHNTTPFPLTGAHINVACNQCHTSSTPPPLDCYSCHVTQWQSTVSLALSTSSVPNHITAGFVPATCASCHTTDSWLGAVFNHAATRFPLTGAHTSVACNLCHLSSAPPPLDCYSCHTAKWNSTATMLGSVPNHLAVDAAAAGIIASACGTCHTTSSNWMGATFSHPWFNNLSHGNNAAGDVCSVCHTNSLGASGNYTIFQCTGCHGNNNAAAFSHPSVGGRYVYNSVNCYQCHSRG